MYWGLRAARAVTTDPKTGQIAHVSPELFNHAHPALILDRLEVGTAIRVHGLRPAPLAFAVPDGILELVQEPPAMIMGSER